MKRSGRIACTLCAVAFGLLGAFTLFLPLPARTDAEKDERYLCLWQDGRTTEEDYFSAYSAFAEASADEIILNGTFGKGTVAPSEEYRRTYRTLTEGSLGDIYLLDAHVNRLESAALWRAFGDCIWYDDGYFIWSGDRIAATQAVKRSEFVLLNGKVSARNLITVGAKTLTVRASAEMTASALIGTEIGELKAEEPYAVHEGALYLHTAGGARLVAGVPALRALTVTGIDWADKGALVACAELEELTLPFVGSTHFTQAEEYTGEFSWLFFANGEYRVPESLKKVTVTGGTLAPFAFYRCAGIEEISACGLDAESVASEAFLSCTGWKRVHSPNANIQLIGEHVRTILPCGCSLFERKEDFGSKSFKNR